VRALLRFLWLLALVRIHIKQLLFLCCRLDMTEKTYNQTEIDAMMAEKDAKLKEMDARMAEKDAMIMEMATKLKEMDAKLEKMAEELAKERARADAAEEAARIATQAARDNAAIRTMAWCEYNHHNVSQKHLAFAACIPYAKLRCREQHLTAANLFQRSL
jgi:N-acetylglutamate synthase/N-acetylornithine aminotransferase